MAVVDEFFLGLPRGLDPGLTGAAPLALELAALALVLIDPSAAAGLISSTWPQLVQVWFMVVICSL